jgi:hypothetical protein
MVSFALWFLLFPAQKSEESKAHEGAIIPSGTCPFVFVWKPFFSRHGADQKGKTAHFISAGFLSFVIFFFLKNI